MVPRLLIFWKISRKVFSSLQFENESPAQLVLSTDKAVWDISIFAPRQLLGVVAGAGVGWGLVVGAAGAGVPIAKR